MRCFPLDHFEVSALAFGLVGGDADALAGDDEAAEIVEIGPELQVVGCCGNGAVECKIFIDRSLPRSIAPSIRASALPTSCRRADVARAAASPAASTSTLWRNSITSSTSLIEGRPPTASRKGRRPISVATKAPAPCRVAVCPQGCYRLAHDRAADAHRSRHLLLGRKAGAGRQLGADDLGGDTLGDLMEQFPRGLDRAQRRGLVGARQIT